MIFRVYSSPLDGSPSHLIHESKTFATLEAEVVEFLGPQPSALHPIERRAWSLAHDAIHEAAATMREATHRV